MSEESIAQKTFDAFDPIFEQYQRGLIDVIVDAAIMYAANYQRLGTIADRLKADALIDFAEVLKRMRDKRTKE